MANVVFFIVVISIILIGMFFVPHKYTMSTVEGFESSAMGGASEDSKIKEDIEQAMQHLGYNKEQREEIRQQIEQNTDLQSILNTLQDELNSKNQDPIDEYVQGCADPSYDNYSTPICSVARFLFNNDGTKNNEDYESEVKSLEANADTCTAYRDSVFANENSQDMNEECPLYFATNSDEMDNIRKSCENQDAPSPFCLVPTMSERAAEIR